MLAMDEFWIFFITLFSWWIFSDGMFQVIKKSNSRSMWMFKSFSKYIDSYRRVKWYAVVHLWYALASGSYALCFSNHIILFKSINNSYRSVAFSYVARMGSKQYWCYHWIYSQHRVYFNILCNEFRLIWKIFDFSCFYKIVK